MARGLILLVHGLGGDPKGTWGRFPELIASDPAVADHDVAFFEYPTSLFRLPFSTRRPSIQTLGDALATILDIRYPDHDPVILVAHSLGGLISRQYLIDRVMAEGELRAHKLLLYAVPNQGAELARVAQHISFRHGQLRQLVHRSDVITNINRAWQQLRMGDKLEIWSVVAALDAVVDEESARGMPGTNTVRVLPDRGHIDCVKPRSAGDLAYEILAQFVTKPLAIEPEVSPRQDRGGDYRVVAFDLDGTLMRGLTFSWTQVWTYLGYPEAVYKEGMRKYLHGQHSYADWCRWAVEMFRLRGLKQSDFAKIAEGLTVTKNLRPAIAALRARGCVTGILSGGIDTLLYEVIPDAAELFDHIYINRFDFGADGVVSGVDPTPYDFESKLDGLEKMAADHGVTLAQAVFVGEGFNDASVTAGAGLSIAYPPRDYSTAAASHVQIAEDDLMKVVEAILIH